ncbi:ORF009R [Largemouth bass ulcerative syndrome virus]|nr:ORF009R [Largemouth bass ulcerative syndrome virus]
MITPMLCKLKTVGAGSTMLHGWTLHAALPLLAIVVAVDELGKDGDGGSREGVPQHGLPLTGTGAFAVRAHDGQDNNAESNAADEHRLLFAGNNLFHVFKD